MVFGFGIGFRPGVRSPMEGNSGPQEYNAPWQYPIKIDTYACVRALTDYPNYKNFIPADELINKAFPRIIEVTKIEPLMVTGDMERDSEITFHVVKTILMLTIDRTIGYETTGRFWMMFRTVWYQFSELTRQHLIQIYKGIYRTNDITGNTVGNQNHQGSYEKEGTNDTYGGDNHKGGDSQVQDQETKQKDTSTTLPQDDLQHNALATDLDKLDYADAVGTNHNLTSTHTVGTNWADNTNWQHTQYKETGWDVSENVSSQSQHSTGMGLPVLEIMQGWVYSYMDMTGGMYYEMKRSGLWMPFIDL